MCNKARVVHRIVSGIGRAPIYLLTKLLINRSSRNSARKLNEPIPRTDLFKSSLVYSGPALWNSLPSELRLPVSPSVFKSVLCFICYLSLALRETMIRYISLHVLLPACDVLLQASHTFCVSVLYEHVVFDDKHVLCACARVYV